MKCIGRVLRGGGWREGDRFVRSAFRFNYNPSGAIVSFGFRLARVKGEDK